MANTNETKNDLDISKLIEEAKEREIASLSEDIMKQLKIIDDVCTGKEMTERDASFVGDMKIRIKKKQKLTKRQQDYLGNVLYKMTIENKKK